MPLRGREEEDTSHIKRKSGGYKFQTGGGKMNLRLPDDAAFSLDAKTGGGTIHNEFGGNEVGNGPHAPLKLRTGGGGIRISRL